LGFKGLGAFCTLERVTSMNLKNVMAEPLATYQNFSAVLTLVLLSVFFFGWLMVGTGGFCVRLYRCRFPIGLHLLASSAPLKWKRRREFGQHSVFWKFAIEYLEIGKTEGEFCDSEPAKLCECCEKTVDSISELYLELLGLELRISWKVGELGKLLQSSKSEGKTFYDDDDDHPFKKALAMKCHQKGKARQVFEHERGSIPHVKKTKEEMESVEEEMENVEEDMENVEEESDYDPGTESNVDESPSEDDEGGEKNASLVKKCEHCGTLLKNKKGLWAHLQRHELKLDLERRFPCPLCPNSFFKLRQSVDIHLSSIHKEPGLKTKMFLETHAKSSQDEEKAEFTCAHCSKNYSNVASFYAHVRDTHKPFPCSYCNETLLGSHAHNAHMLESHPCPTCSKCFPPNQG
ncbi:PR domain zinc finger protein 14, partial [Orchesella cincta]